MKCLDFGFTMDVSGTFLLIPLQSSDRVFNSEESTNQLYNDIAKPLVVSTVEGYNGESGMTWRRM